MPRKYIKDHKYGVFTCDICKRKFGKLLGLSNHRW